jgi:hypothetical protein
LPGSQKHNAVKVIISEKQNGFSAPPGIMQASSSYFPPTASVEDHFELKQIEEEMTFNC